MSADGVSDNSILQKKNNWDIVIEAKTLKKVFYARRYKTELDESLKMWHNIPWYRGYDLDELITYWHKFEFFSGDKEDMTISKSMAHETVDYLQELASQNKNSVWYKYVSVV